MRRPPPGIPGIPPEVYDAIEVFTDEELAGLKAYYQDTTGKFVYIGFVSKTTGKITKWADQAKYDAIAIMEDACRREQPYLPPPGLHSFKPSSFGFKRGKDGKLYFNWQ